MCIWLFCQQSKIMHHSLYSPVLKKVHLTMNKIVHNFLKLLKSQSNPACLEKSSPRQIQVPKREYCGEWIQQFLYEKFLHMIKMFSVRKHIYSNQEAYVLTEWQLRVMNQQAQEKEYKIAH